MVVNKLSVLTLSFACDTLIILLNMDDNERNDRNRNVSTIKASFHFYSYKAF